jgi:hypothetical protein
MVIARRQAAAAIAAVALMFGGAAAVSATQIITEVTQADSSKPRPVPPTSPRGLDRSGVDRPDQANTPRTGPR